ncbi:GH3 auxin-responsive promoter [Corchorus capsularis]|uniref:GH3 auxin-responsive promoter n=1 Tax=Corchorus capsularis TaxID=210143 RepID=A0A1R3HZN7_COCAP|nr:GH3 auxin-responsive promoter [Corchorus capsularis]
MASIQIETKEHEDGWQKLEELTMNAHQVQEKLLEKILKRNAGTEYLRGFLNGQADKNVFREKVPIVTYEDIKPYIDRIVNGEPSDILLADPILEFMQSSGTSGGQPKFVPSTAETLEHMTFALTLRDHLMQRTMEFEDGLQKLEELTINASQIQEKLLEEILKRNAETEYLRGFLNGQAEKQVFKKNVPIVTYEEIRPYIDRIANGEPSHILLADPIVEFMLSSGTSGGKPKLIPSTAESFETRMFESTLVDPLMHKHFDGLEKGKHMYLAFVKPDNETPCGLKANFFSTIWFNSNSFKNGWGKDCTSPIETILCLDNKQSMYCQLLASLIQRDQVVWIGSIFASVVAMSIKNLQDYWKEFCLNIRTGHVSDWISDPGCKNAISSLLKGPNPELADAIEHICNDQSWKGLVKRLWPKAKYISCIVTGSMSQYISLLDFYGDGIPLVSTFYGGSEATFGLNVNPLSKPSDISYTFLPTSAYFEFLPVNKDGDGEKAHQGFPFDDPIHLVNVKLGQYYELVITTLTGLYRYKVEDVLKVAGFYNKSPQFKFVERQNMILSIDVDKTSEADLLKAMENATLLLDSHGIVLTSYTSYSDTSLTPGRYVLFWELKMKEGDDFPKLHQLTMEQCCSRVENSFDFMYKSLRNNNTIAPLEIRVVEHGTFDALMDFYVSKGASIAQYKTPSCVKSEEAKNILNSRVVANFFSPKNIF